MLRFFLTALLIIVQFVIQATLFPHIAVLGVQPNTALILVISCCILRSDLESAAVGFFTGLLQDLFFSRALGLFALIGLLIGYLFGKPFRNFYRENYWLPLLLTLLAAASSDFAVYVFYFLFRGKTDLWYYGTRVILPGTLYTAVLSIPLYRLYYGLNNLLEARENRRRRMF